MSDSDTPLLRVAAARADFLEHGRKAAAGVSDLVVASWERSQVAGVDVTRPRSVFSEEIDRGSLLARCAQPVLEQLEADTTDMPLVIALTDKKARVIQRIDCSPTVARLLERVQFAPGFDYSEATMGTNGVGTVFEASQPVSVVGPEHFTEDLQRFACTGAPILDPVTGRVEGVLDISTLAPTWNPIMHSLAKSAAKDIGRNLLLDRSQAQHAIFETYLHATARSSRQAVFAFGDSVFVASPAAQELFNADEQQVLREHATFLMARRERASDTLVLPGGERLVHIRGTRILAGSEVAGMVVIAEVIKHQCAEPSEDFSEQRLPRAGVANQLTSQIADSLFHTRDSFASGHSPAWVRACGELREALMEKQPTLLIGEAGVGKVTLVMELFHSIYPNAHSISVDAKQLGMDALDDRSSDIASLLGNPSAPTLHVVRDIDQASTDGLEQLAIYFSTVESLDGPAWIVATASQAPSPPELPFHQLLDYFDVAINIPPLRCRTDDLPAITCALLHGVAPDRKVRLSPSAQRVICRYSWPHNISQLREALVHALRQRPIGEIQDVDLPGYCQTTSRRTLSTLEAIERDAIVAALHDTDGNRVAAATQLGMSRSSLYRKLKTYGITV